MYRTHDIDSTSTEHTKEVILDTTKRLYRNHICKIHRHFHKYETPEEALENKSKDSVMKIGNIWYSTSQVLISRYVILNILFKIV